MPTKTIRVIVKCSLQVQANIDAILKDPINDIDYKNRYIPREKESAQRRIEEVIENYAINDLTGVLRMGVNTNIKSIEFNQLLEIYSKEIKSLDYDINALISQIREANLNENGDLVATLTNQAKELTTKQSKIKAIKGTDLSMYATLKGYDAIELSDRGYLIILIGVS